MVGRHVLDMGILHPEDIKRAAASMARLYSGASDIERNQYRFITKNGEVLEVDVTGTVRRDEAGEIVSVTNVAIDITEQKRAEQALRESEELWRTLSETSPDGIVVTDAEGHFVAISERAKTLADLTDEPLLGRYDMEFLDGKQRDTAEAVLRDSSWSDSTSRTEYELTRSDGSTVVVEANASYVHDSHGELRLIVSVVRDITERKRAEEELRKMNEELSGYAETVSHDLRAPLSTLLTTVGLLEAAIGSDKSVENVQELIDLLKVVARNTYERAEHLLTLAKAGQEPLEVADVDARALVTDVLLGLATMIDDRNAVIEPDEDLGVVHANRTQLGQVFSNLVANAIVHGNGRDPRVEVRYLGDDAAGAHRYMVRYNGPGLAPGTEDMVFNPFYKGADAEGTGIGLSDSGQGRQGLRRRDKSVQRQRRLLRVHPQGRVRKGARSCLISLRAFLAPPIRKDLTPDGLRRYLTSLFRGPSRKRVCKSSPKDSPASSPSHCERSACTRGRTA